MNHELENNSNHKDLLRILAECGAECDVTFNASLDNDRTDELTRVIRLCRDCANICYATARFVGSDSEHARHLARECAEICRSCAEACENNVDKEHECKPCAKICRACEEACRSFAGVEA
ncbi:four-helix bundle copper-binding protein [Pontibacter actiniarum]|uniref:Four-helix bundle copper-binding protein n=1 Tax=Pontibacter actiniarum TaxID=323450 RepID=A0A1X9YYZ6_9BACT|nr:four-helix bundle copper-binding protein [Pontibacter actiniarum]ARS38089.1 four-helix bundle copper-binding protein [Pontibacter actiniarum]